LRIPVKALKGSYSARQFPGRGFRARSAVSGNHQAGRNKFKEISGMEGEPQEPNIRPQSRVAESWRAWPPLARQAGADESTLNLRPGRLLRPHIASLSTVWPLTSSARATVMSTAQPAMPARPIRCKVRRPALSTTNSCGQGKCQCYHCLMSHGAHPPRGSP
jgi:hypothetical protein